MGPQTIRHGNTKYPWQLWMDGNTHIAIAGRDFDEGMSVQSFQSSLSAKAKRNGMKIKSGSDGNVVTFRFIHPEGS